MSVSNTVKQERSNNNPELNINLLFHHLRDSHQNQKGT